MVPNCNYRYDAIISKLIERGSTKNLSTQRTNSMVKKNYHKSCKIAEAMCKDCHAVCAEGLMMDAEDGA